MIQNPINHLVKMAQRSQKVIVFESFTSLIDNYEKNKIYFDINDISNNCWFIYLKLNRFFIELGDKNALNNYPSSFHNWSFYSKMNEPSESTNFTLIYLWWQIALVDANELEIFVRKLKEGSPLFDKIPENVIILVNILKNINVEYLEISKSLFN